MRNCSAIFLIAAGLTCAAQSLEQQVRQQYRPTRVGINGVIIGDVGSILVVHEDGLGALPANLGYWANNVTDNGRIKENVARGLWNLGIVGAARRINVGERMYITAMEFKPREVTIFLQTVPDQDWSMDGRANVFLPPYRARLTFHIRKAFEPLEMIARVFGRWDASQQSGSDSSGREQ